MGCSWTPTGATEVGIDGYIELFDRATGAALGKTLAAQSKVLATFPNDTTEGFDYYCMERDLAYWLQGNMPVVLIIVRPETSEAYWISIKDYFDTPERRATRRAHFSKATQRFDSNCHGEFFRLGRQADAGLHLGPIPREERLMSNLLMLKGFPSRLWTAATHFKKPQEIWPLLDNQQRRITGDWILREQMIMSFQNLSERPWSSICDQGACEDFATTEWAFSADDDRRRQFVDLLNRALKEQVYPDVRYWPHQDCYAFHGTPENAPVKRDYLSIRRKSSMTVVSRYKKIRKRDGAIFHWLRHLSFRSQFRLFDDQWYLELTPTYIFSSDGSRLDRFHEDRLRKIKRIEGNRAVLSAVAIWADFLRSKDDLLKRDSTILEFGDLLEVTVPLGIDDASWSATSGERAPDDDDLFSLLGEHPT